MFRFSRGLPLLIVVAGLLSCQFGYAKEPDKGAGSRDKKTALSAAKGAAELKSAEVVRNPAFPQDFRYGLKLLDAGDVKGCLAHVKKFSSKPGKVDWADKLYLLEGLCLQANHQDEDALRSFKQALKFRGSNSDASHHLGISYFNLGRYAEALSAFQEALWFEKLQLKTKQEVQYWIGKSYLEQGFTDRAEKAFLEASSGPQSYVPAKLELAAMSLTQGRKAPAVRYLKESLDASPNDPKLKIRLIEALLMRVDHPPALAEAKEAERLALGLLGQAQGDQSLKNRAFPLYIRALLEEDNLQAAQENIEKAIRADSDNLELLSLQRQIGIAREAKQAGL